MIDNIISIGDKLELIKIKQSTVELDNEKTYKSQLLDFVDDQTLIIQMPMEKVRIIPLSVGDKYSIHFFTKRGLYQCNSIITARSKMNNIYVLKVELTSALEKKQRREFYRLECVLDMEYCLISDIEISIMNKFAANNFKDEKEIERYLTRLHEIEHEWHKGIIVDISGGGAKFVTDKPYEYGSLIHIAVPFDLTMKLKNKWIKAMIISSDEMINRRGSYENRIQFKDIAKEDREVIIRFIFEEERRLRNKDKGI